MGGGELEDVGFQVFVSEEAGVKRHDKDGVIKSAAG